MAAEATEGEMDRYPRDFLRRFSGASCTDSDLPAVNSGGDSGEIELTLGLSLGGCFGLERKDKGLVRSSSISTLSMFNIDHEFSVPRPPLLARTVSLPTETEEERRKRKEMQSLKRLEAKRKRSEKRNFRFGLRDRKEESMDEDVEGGQGSAAATPVAPPVSKGSERVVNGIVPPELPRWMGPGKVAGGQPADAAKGFGPVSQGSIGSSGSSGVFDFEAKPPMQGFDVLRSNNCSEVKSPSTDPSPLDRPNHKAAATPPSPVPSKPINSCREEDHPAKKPDRRANGTEDVERNMMEEMPCVSTRGDGPNGRRIEGFLYKYRKGEEVRIVCVCHGSFLTPAEFVKHAGGGDVTHPLRHIVVNPTPPAFL